ncbi:MULTISPECIES: porin [unclassified Mesorhizobium]|uniref:porin n=1 Tax=unclassified Mesorhizobium TaxID=325217 RepID=UPI000FEA1324|nr:MULTISPECIES: porin [unclassified Mesorhizobium]RWI18912.1 MAG: porin [Mesorhizobium sp.]RWK44768.1 MAG: porin [Mesorhizobium sp.]RWK85251.1 MAG: porin [Mesorhizobium sp.]RWK92823.1 MAG: porin [Mesorhizobium sp.]TIP56862.1 MAG: porin [Mesorhizobium sp.]
MNIKSLLLGSAAALVAVSGARAADAVVVAEPEPAEYVRICDVYGAGYFYIPGTEICLRIGGYVRYDIGVGDIGAFTGAQNGDAEDGDLNDTYWKRARLSLRTWTGQETELGTLKTYTETRFNFLNTQGSAFYNSADDDDAVSLNFAWLQLGGLRVGKDESAFLTFHDYAGAVINDTLVPYGSFDTNVVQYYFDAGNGFSAVISLEQGAGDIGTIDSYVPHVVGGVKWTQGWGAITGVIAYDSNYEEVAGKVKLDVKPMENLSLFIMAGYGTDDNLNDDGYAKDANGRGFYKNWGGNWAVWGGGTYTINEKTSFNLQASYDEWENLGIAANIAYDIVPGLTITAEVDYLHAGDFDDPDFSNWTGADDEDSIGGILRFQRSF